jgi:hypothetical protein
VRRSRARSVLYQRVAQQALFLRQRLNFGMISNHIPEVSFVAVLPLDCLALRSCSKLVSISESVLSFGPQHYRKRWVDSVYDTEEPSGAMGRWVVVMESDFGNRDPRSWFCCDQESRKGQEVGVRHVGTLDNPDTGYTLEDRSAWTVQCIIHQTHERGTVIIAYGSIQGVCSHNGVRDRGRQIIDVYRPYGALKHKGILRNGETC